jgi:hypothetical protein
MRLSNRKIIALFQNCFLPTVTLIYSPSVASSVHQVLLIAEMYITIKPLLRSLSIANLLT